MSPDPAAPASPDGERRPRLVGLWRVVPALTTATLLLWAFRRVPPPPGEVAWAAGFLASGWLRARHLSAVAGQPVAARHADLPDRLAFAALFAATVALPLLWLATGWPAALDYAPPPGAWPAGAALMATGTALLWRAHRDLGANYSPAVELRASHTLTTHGLYARLRHPIYAAIGLGALAQPLLLPNWLAGVPAPLAWAALCALRLPREERLLAERFGPAWDAYAARTGRLLPRWR